MFVCACVSMQVPNSIMPPAGVSVCVGVCMHACMRERDHLPATEVAVLAE